MSVTIGIASLLSGEDREEVLSMWNVFETEYNSFGVQSFNHPNLGFQGGNCLNIESLKSELSNLCDAVSPFDVVVNGVNFFEAPSKVVYLKVLKTKELMELHNKINNSLKKCCNNLFELYTPENWVPHITIAMGDLSDENFIKFKETYNDYSPSFNHLISNLVLVEFNSNGRVELLNSYEIK